MLVEVPGDDVLVAILIHIPHHDRGGLVSIGEGEFQDEFGLLLVGYQAESLPQRRDHLLGRSAPHDLVTGTQFGTGREPAAVGTQTDRVPIGCHLHRPSRKPSRGQLGVDLPLQICHQDVHRLIVVGGGKIDLDRDGLHTDVDTRPEVPLTIVQVQSVGLPEIAGDGIQVPVAVHIRQCHRGGQIGDERVLIENGSGEVRDGIGQLTADAAHVLPGIKAPIAVVEIAAVELGEIAGHQVQVPVVVDIAQGHRRGQRVSPASVLSRHAVERRGRPVVEVEPVGRARPPFRHGCRHRQHQLMRRGLDVQVVGCADYRAVADVRMGAVLQCAQVQRRPRPQEPAAGGGFRPGPRRRGHLAVRLQGDVVGRASRDSASSPWPDRQWFQLPAPPLPVSAGRSW